MRQDRLERALEKCRGELAKDGVTLSIETHPDRILEIIEILKDKDVTPEMHPFLSPFTPGNCFWLVAEKDGIAISAGGARMDDLEDLPASEFLRLSARRYHGQGFGKSPLLVNPALDDRLGGKLVYFGHLRSDTGKGSLRRTELFVRAGLMMSAIKWDPDHIYCWIRRRDLLRGAAELYGFATVTRAAQQWVLEPKGRSNTEHCVSSSRADLDLLAADICSDYTGLQ